MSESGVRKIMYQLLVGLSHIHSASIVHRDLKLENIMIKFDDEKKMDQVKIIDFGLSTKLDFETTGFVGTPN